MYRAAFYFITFFIIVCQAQAQIDFNELPKSFNLKECDYNSLSILKGDPIDVNALLNGDNESNWLRSGVTKSVGVDIRNAGKWIELDEGGRIWLCRLKAPNA